MKSWKLFCLLLFMFFLSACNFGEADKFIEMESTKEEARAMIEGAMEEKGIVAEAGTVDYDRVGKGRDVERIYVSYETKNIPTYTGRAFIHVDVKSKPRKLAEIDHLGLISPGGGFVSIGSEIMEFLKLQMYEPFVSEVEEIMQTIDGLVWDGDEKIVVGLLEPKEEKVEEMIELYADEQFADVTAEEATELFELFQQKDDSYDNPNVVLAFHYEGEMDNETMQRILETIAEMPNLPEDELMVRVTGNSYNETEESIYNNWKSDGSVTGTYMGVVKQGE